MSGSLDNHGDRIAAAETQSREASLRVAVLHRIQKSREHAGAAAADRMTERDRAAVHVELLVRDPELAHHHEARGRVRLVVLEQVDILDPEARLLQELPDAGDRRFHDRLRLHADGVVRDDAASGFTPWRSAASSDITTIAA